MVIRVYGFEEDPYLLPSFLNPRIYFLEYIRQRVVVDLFHFVYNNKISNFKLQQNIGPFFVKNRLAMKLVNEMMQDIRFHHGERIIYNPYNNIANKREHYKLSYENQFSLELDRVENQYD